MLPVGWAVFCRTEKRLPMPAPGLSLVGFIADPQHAINHLLNVCVPANPNPTALMAEWSAAKAKIGPPFANTGRPSVQTLPASQNAHVAQLFAHPIFAQAWNGATVELME